MNERQKEMESPNLRKVEVWILGCETEYSYFIQ
jgi:hypothetical protein